MKKHSINQGFALATLALLLGSFTAQAESSFGVNLGLSYSHGSGGNVYGAPGYGSPAFGYGASAGSLGSIGGCFQQQQPIYIPQANSCNVCAQAHAQQGYGPGYGPVANGPMFPPMPQLPPLPAMRPVQPPAPLLPPHLSAQNMGWGPNFASYPGPQFPGMNQGHSCVPCSLGMNVPVIGPVPGGPVIQGGGFDSGLYAEGGFGYNDGYVENEWQKHDTGEIIWATGRAMAGMSTSSGIIAEPSRGAITQLAPYPYAPNDRNDGYIPRPAH